MLFKSIEFLLFLPVVVGLYYAIPAKWRWAMLLGASYYFYMCWKVEYVLLLVLSTGVDYAAGIQMGKEQEKKGRRKYLILSLVANLGLLLSFKYLGFFSTNAEVLFEQFNLLVQFPDLGLLLPMGISFYTFQSLSYTIDVYKGKIKPEKHLGYFALFVSFFPQLVAGPIERAGSLLPQFKQTYQFNEQRFKSGLQLMLWGFFKKIVIADRLADYVELVYDQPGAYTGLPVIMATIFFTFQIYCDFSGYSDIAIGAARLLGINLSLNFRRPFFATSIADFWRRWHITLSGWFKEYVYIPLGGNRVKVGRWYFNLLATFLISGLWHGANWTFIIWGAIHGGLMVLGTGLNQPMKRIWAVLGPIPSRTIQIATTFSLVCFAFIFFRSASFSDAMVIIESVFGGTGIRIGALNVTGNFWQFPLCFGAVILLMGVEVLQATGRLTQILKGPRSIRWAIYLGVIMTIMIFGQFDEQPFIYFQF